MDNYVADHDAFLLANHGVVTIGQSLMNAYYKMETVEHFAKISLVARQIGNENVFSPERAQELIDARARYGVVAGAGCRIESKEKDPQVTYAPEVPRTGFGAAGYAGAGQPAAGSDMVNVDEGQVRDLVAEVTRRVLAGLQK